MISFHDDDINHKVHNCVQSYESEKIIIMKMQWYYGEWWMPLRESLSFNSIKNLFDLFAHIPKAAAGTSHYYGFFRSKIQNICIQIYAAQRDFSVWIFGMKKQQHNKNNHFDSNAIHLRSIFEARLMVNGFIISGRVFISFFII